MVRIVKRGSYYDAVNHKEIMLIEGACLAADTKPTNQIATGSTMTEVDTGNVYMFAEGGAGWVKLTTIS